MKLKSLSEIPVYHISRKVHSYDILSLENFEDVVKSSMVRQLAEHLLDNLDMQIDRNVLPSGDTEYTASLKVHVLTPDQMHDIAVGIKKAVMYELAADRALTDFNPKTVH